MLAGQSGGFECFVTYSLPRKRPLMVKGGNHQKETGSECNNDGAEEFEGHRKVTIRTSKQGISVWGTHRLRAGTYTATIGRGLGSESINSFPGLYAVGG